MPSRRRTPVKKLEAMGRAIEDKTAEPLIGVCITCEDRHWFGVDDVGESCPADCTEDRHHECNYYVLVGITRREVKQ
jgi:hypothetical protein